jgi:hypothetical protein
MLPRVLEPEAMDTPEEARDHDAMDHTTVNARFVADFRAAHGPCRGVRRKRGQKPNRHVLI